MRRDAANRQDVKCTVMKHQREGQSRERIPAGSNATGKDDGYGRFSSEPGVVVLVDWPQGCLPPPPASFKATELTRAQVETVEAPCLSGGQCFCIVCQDLYIRVRTVQRCAGVTWPRPWTDDP